MSSPTELYNIDFDNIKQNIKEEYSNIKDYGSSIIIDCAHSSVDVFCDGRIKVLGDKCGEARRVVNRIKTIFKKQIGEISYDDDEDIELINAVTSAMEYMDEYDGDFQSFTDDDYLVRKLRAKPGNNLVSSKKSAVKKNNEA